MPQEIQRLEQIFGTPSRRGMAVIHTAPNLSRMPGIIKRREQKAAGVPALTPEQQQAMERNRAAAIERKKRKAQDTQAQTRADSSQLTAEQQRVVRANRREATKRKHARERGQASGEAPALPLHDSFAWIDRAFGTTPEQFHREEKALANANPIWDGTDECKWMQTDIDEFTRRRILDLRTQRESRARGGNSSASRPPGPQSHSKGGLDDSEAEDFPSSDNAAEAAQPAASSQSAATSTQVAPAPRGTKRQHEEQEQSNTLQGQNRLQTVRNRILARIHARAETPATPE